MEPPSSSSGQPLPDRKERLLGAFRVFRAFRVIRVPPPMLSRHKRRESIDATHRLHRIALGAILSLPERLRTHTRIARKTPMKRMVRGRSRCRQQAGRWQVAHPPAHVGKVDTLKVQGRRGAV